MSDSKKIIILGGCGAVGSVAVKTLAAQDDFDEIVIGDINEKRAAEIQQELGGKILFRQVDASDAASIAQAVEGCDLVLNCVGPFYKTVKTVLETVIDAGINYVDVCDDVDVTLEILDWSEKASAKGITALIGMGSSPGVTNILAKFASTMFLDETESVDIFHAHGGEPVEGAGVIGHRFHCMSIEIPMYLDGKLEYVNYFEPDGIALRQSFDFPVIGDNIPLYPYPHPEQVTLPTYLDLKQVTNKGTVLPNAYYNLTKDMCALGLNSRDAVNVAGQEVVPYDFAVAYILRERERLLKESDFGEQCGCVSVVVKGSKGGKAEEYRFHLASEGQALGEGTGIPAAMGALLVHRGKIDAKGVFPPEGCVNPQDFMGLLPQVMKLGSSDEKSFSGVIVERVDADGNVTSFNI